MDNDEVVIDQEWDDRWNAINELHLHTQGSKKVWSYFSAVLRGEKFLKSISELRSKYHFPPDGFIDTADEVEWGKTHTYDEKKMMNDVRGLMNKYSLDHFEYQGTKKEYVMHAESMHHLVSFYLMYGRLMWKPSWLSIGNLCLLSDMRQAECGGCHQKFSNSDLMGYPTAIFISPYASKRDILDFVNRLYKQQIEPLQKKHRVAHIKIGKVRSKNPRIEERNDFIYANRKLPRKELSAMVGKKFGKTLGYHGITSVIAAEKRRRKEL